MPRSSDEKYTAILFFDKASNLRTEIRTKIDIRIYIVLTLIENTMNFHYKNTRIFVFADSHGLHKHIEIPKDTDVTICLGDAVEDNLDPQDYDRFLKWFSEQPGQKYFLPGNHELIFDIAPRWGELLFKERDIKLCRNEVEVINGISFYFHAVGDQIHLLKEVDFVLSHYPPEMIEYFGEIRPIRHLYGHDHDTEASVYVDDTTIYSNVCCYNLCRKRFKENLEQVILRIKNKRRNRK